MTVVVADTSPLNYLVLLGVVDIVPRLYQRVIVPQQVLEELSDPGAPPEVAAWVAGPPDWLEIRSAPPVTDPAVAELDAGEAAAILLAQEIGAALLLIDDAAGRKEAGRRGIRHTGTLGVLRAAASARLLDFSIAIEKLRTTNFRVSDALIAKISRGYEK